MRYIAVVISSVFLFAACGDSKSDQLKAEKEKLDKRSEHAKHKQQQAEQKLYAAAARTGLARANLAIAKVCLRATEELRMPTSAERQVLKHQIALAKRFAKNYPAVYAEYEAKLTRSMSTCAPELLPQLPEAF